MQLQLRYAYDCSPHNRSPYISCVILQLNRSISKLLSENRARSNKSNTREFIRPRKRRKEDASQNMDVDTEMISPPGLGSTTGVTDPSAPPIPNQDTEEYFSSARTSTKRVDRETQMRYDIAKNPEGPLGRTMHGKLLSPGPRSAEGQGSGGVLSKMLKEALLSSPGTPIMPRHPGLQERFDGIENHLAIRWSESPL